MGHRCCSKQKVKRGLWSPEEDEKLVQYITTHGHGSWSSVPKLAGLQRCGKSCRLRWINYLRPDLKRGSFSAEEEQIIIDVHRILGNRWAQIAKHLPGRTDNEVKNFWNSCIKKKLISQGFDPKTHKLMKGGANYNKVTSSTCNILPPSHNQPFSIITVNSKNMKVSSSMDIIKPPILTPPPNTSQPPLILPQTMSLHPNSNNPLWTSNGHDSNAVFSCASSNIDHQNINIPLSSSMNLSGLGLLEEICFSSGNNNNDNNVERFEEQRLESMQVEQDKEQTKEKGSNTNEIDGCANGNNAYHQDLDGSFDSSSFDLEFVESTLLSDSMCRDLSSMDDFAWNF